MSMSAKSFCASMMFAQSLRSAADPDTGDGSFSLRGMRVWKLELQSAFSLHGAWDIACKLPAHLLVSWPSLHSSETLLWFSARQGLQPQRNRSIHEYNLWTTKGWSFLTRANGPQSSIQSNRKTTSKSLKIRCLRKMWISYLVSMLLPHWSSGSAKGSVALTV